MSRKREPHPIARQLTLARRERGLTQRDVATLTGIAQSSISNYEIGLTSPTLEMLDIWATALRCSLAVTKTEEENGS